MVVRGRWMAALVMALGLFLGGCASAPRTTVVLLPDADGHVGAVVVSDAAGSQRIDQAYHAVTIADAKAKPSASTPRGQAPVEGAYGALLKAEPSKPAQFVLNFVLDTATLTPESKALLPEVLKAARERKPTEITVFGHADAIGTEQRNLQLSCERARAVAEWLRKADPTLDRVEVQYFGDRVPLYPSDGHSPEPRNRRAEVVIL